MWFGGPERFHLNLESGRNQLKSSNTDSYNHNYHTGWLRQCTSPADDKLRVMPFWHLKCMCFSILIAISVSSKTEYSLRSCCYTNLLQSHSSFWLQMYIGLDPSPEGPCEQENTGRQHAWENRPTPHAFYLVTRVVSTNELNNHP